MAVVPEYRGRGIGTQLLARVLSSPKVPYAAVSLNVPEDNPTVNVISARGIRCSRGQHDYQPRRRRIFNMLRWHASISNCAESNAAAPKAGRCRPTPSISAADALGQPIPGRHDAHP